MAAATGAAAADPATKRMRVEAVLLLARTPLTSRKLAQLAGLADATEARTLVRQLNGHYDQTRRAFRAEEVAGGYQLLTRPALASWLRRLSHIPAAVQLTPPALETLAIIAYRQPVLRADVEAIRGVNCGEILRQLMDRDLVRISGRSEELGRPYLYSTSKRFLQIFGLRNIEALPHADWFHREAEFSDPADGEVDSEDPASGTAAEEEKESPVSIQLANPVLDADTPEACAPHGPIASAVSSETSSPTAVLEEDDVEEEYFEEDDEDEFDDEDDEEEYEDEEYEDEEYEGEEDEDLEEDAEELEEEDGGWEEVGEDDEDEDWDDEDEWDDEEGVESDEDEEEEDEWD